MEKTFLQMANEDEKFNEHMWFMLENLEAYKKNELTDNQIKTLEKISPNWIAEVEEVISEIKDSKVV